MLKIIKENRRLRKENAELRKAIEETLRELNDAGFGNVRANRLTSSGIRPTKTISSRGRKVKLIREKSRFYF